jgi:hypothetical protein
VTDMVAFLKARYDEEEATAGSSRTWKVEHHDCAEPEWDPCTEQPCPYAAECAEGTCGHASVVGSDGMRIYPEGGHTALEAEHIARWDPARVLREVEAKRKILDALQEAEAALDRGYTDLVRGSQLTLLRACRFLAAVYSDHPDYDQSWEAS